MPKILERNGKVVVRPDGRIALDCDPDCCGPAGCSFYWRFQPCNIESPDPACTPPPEFGDVYICGDLLCTAKSPHRPGLPLGGSTFDFLVIWYEGQCWRRVGGSFQLADIPAGSVILDAGEFECLGLQCNDIERCGELHYAEAVPCDPSVPRPWPLYCPGGLPFSCSTINPAAHYGGLPSNWNNCFTFRRDAATQPYPPNTPILYFPPNGPWVDGVTCCQCNCTGGPPIPHLYCPGTSPGGYCCPDTALWDPSPFVLDAFYRIDTPEEIAGYPGAFTELIFSSLSTAGAPTITVRYRIGQPGGGVEEGFNQIDAPIPRITCPLNALVLILGVGLFPQAPEIFDSCFESRRYNRWVGSWTGRNNTGTPGVFRTLQFNWNVRVLSPQPPGCSNESCSGAQPAMAPATGGGGTMPVDPAVSAWMRQSYGGCGSCGDSPNPL